MITELRPNEIFVFGSNLAGMHVGGAARQAEKQFGAQEGVGEGPTGQCYAFPTLDEHINKRSIVDLNNSVVRFGQFARSQPDKTFLLTPVGTGIAGYKYEVIEDLFSKLPSNVKKVGWRN